jgi:hypothetical protein
VFESRRTRWEGLVERMRGRIGAYRVLSGKAEGKGGYLETPDVDERIVLKWRFFKKLDWEGGNELDLYG